MRSVWRLQERTIFDVLFESLRQVDLLHRSFRSGNIRCHLHCIVNPISNTLWILDLNHRSSIGTSYLPSNVGNNNVRLPGLNFAIAIDILRRIKQPVTICIFIIAYSWRCNVSNGVIHKRNPSSLPVRTQINAS